MAFKSAEELIGSMREQLTQFSYGSPERQVILHQLETVQQNRDTINRVIQVAKQRFPLAADPLMEMIKETLVLEGSQKPLSSFAQILERTSYRIEHEKETEAAAATATTNLFKQLGVKTK